MTTDRYPHRLLVLRDSQLVPADFLVRYCVEDSDDNHPAVLHLSTQHFDTDPRQATVADLLTALSPSSRDSVTLCRCAEWNSADLGPVISDSLREAVEWLSALQQAGDSLYRVATLWRQLDALPAPTGHQPLDDLIGRVTNQVREELTHLTTRAGFRHGLACELIRGVRTWSNDPVEVRRLRAVDDVADIPAPAIPSWETSEHRSEEPEETIAALGTPLVWLRLDLLAHLGERVWAHLTDVHPGHLGRFPAALLYLAAVPREAILGIDAGFTSGEVTAAASVVRDGVALRDMVSALRSTHA